MARHVDALTAATLKNLREQWWDSEFSSFLQETLRPRPGNRILDVGCGEGTAEMSLGRLRVSQLALFAIDRNLQRVAQTAAEGRSHNYRLQLAGADVTRLPFTTGAFDATFCVAVLQHVNDVPLAVRELARVTRTGGRVLAVEPDNAARYWYSSSPPGRAGVCRSLAFLQRGACRPRRQHRAGRRAARLGHLRARAASSRCPCSCFRSRSPTSGGHRPRSGRRAATPCRRLLGDIDDPAVIAQGRDYLQTLARYKQDATAAGANFVEIQNTMLFATVGQRTDAPVDTHAPTVLSAEC